MTAVVRKLSVLLHHFWKTGEVYEPLRKTQAESPAAWRHFHSSSKCRVPGDCARTLAQLARFASSEADVKIAAPTHYIRTTTCTGPQRDSSRVRIEARRNAGLKNTGILKTNEEGKHAREKSRTLLAQAEFILSIGDEACGFLQKSHVSELANFHAKPYAFSLSPCLPNQFVPLCV